MSVAVVTMVRNEADRYLRSAFSCWRQWADEIIAYDDHSTDATPELLQDCTIVPPVQKAEAWGNESVPRVALWNAALQSKCDWLIWLDADMIPAANPCDLQARDVDAIAFRLYDLWDWRSSAYRVDGAWQAHHNPRIWMIRNPRRGEWQWNERGIHCGHMPINYQPQRVLIAPQEYGILHYGYAEATDRPIKAAQYASTEQQMSAAEITHARSINDESYITFPLPFIPQWRLTHERASSSAHQSGSSRLSLMPTTDPSEL